MSAFRKKKKNQRQEEESAKENFHHTAAKLKAFTQIGHGSLFLGPTLKDDAHIKT